MEIKLCMMLAIMMFVLVLVVVALSVFFTFRIEKAYTTRLNLDDESEK